jgi:molybdopterin synthase catalytic subunit
MPSPASQPQARSPEVAGSAPEAGPAGPAAQHGAQDRYAIQADPIDLAALVAEVAEPGSGAIATFSGTVRDSFEGRRVLHLEYEAYEGMALKVLREIGAALHERFEVSRVAIVHRTGRLEVGETSVAIAVSAAHRAAALAACALAIERLKAELPVWKKEFFEDGAVWRENETRSGARLGDTGRGKTTT